MPIFLFDTFGTASIGVYTIVTEEIALVPKPVPDAHVGKFRNWLGVDVVRTNIGGSILLGSLACANSHGMVLPHFVRDEEVELIKSSVNLDLTIMPTKKTAYGNLILANDFGAVIDPRLRKSDVKLVEDTLDVEAVSGEITRLPYVGSLATATNKGILVHPLITEEEQNVVKDALKVDVGVGTVNCGIPFIATGLRGNSRAAVAGSLTTGPELFMIGQALDVVD